MCSVLCGTTAVNQLGGERWLRGKSNFRKATVMAEKIIHETKQRKPKRECIPTFSENVHQSLERIFIYSKGSLALHSINFTLYKWCETVSQHTSEKNATKCTAKWNCESLVNIQALLLYIYLQCDPEHLNSCFWGHLSLPDALSLLAFVNLTT